MVNEAEYDKVLQARFKQVLSVPQNPLVEFIDYKKLFLSHLFEQAWTFASRKFEESGNSTFICQLINSLPIVDWKLFLTGYACERFALHASSKNMKSIQFKKNKKIAPNTSLRFSQCLMDFKSSRMDIEKYKNGAYASIRGQSAIKRIEKRETGTDLLDSGLVYPGSFENGRRR